MTDQPTLETDAKQPYGERMARLLRENEAVMAALWDYHHALDTRQHAGVAADKMVKAVEVVLGKPWKQGATLKEPPQNRAHEPE